MTLIDPSEGRAAFGQNVFGYDSARPAYPEWIYRAMIEQGALLPNTVTLEIGAGNGLATRKLSYYGAAPLHLIEPDDRFTHLLAPLVDYRNESVRLTHLPFEEMALPEALFDLVAVATAFHWLDPKDRVVKLSKALKAGGMAALFWNVFQDMSRPDDFHEATKSILAQLASSPSGAPDELPFALNQSARIAEFVDSGLFELVFYAQSHWQYALDAAGIRDLYEGFSSISRLDEHERNETLDRLEQIARNRFGNKVHRNMTSPLYLFRRL